MQSLIQFIIQYHASFLFLFIEGMCGLLIINNHTFHQVRFLNASNVVSGHFYQSGEMLSGYIRLRKKNKQLHRENALLREMLSNKWITRYRQDTLVRKFDFQNQHWIQNYAYTPAQVIKNSIHTTTNYIVLNKGRKQGIDKNMGVINEEGLVGVVVDVSDNFSSVMSLLHKKLHISGFLSKTEHFGTITWSGKGYRSALLKDIPKHVQVDIGDTVMSSGYSSFFPSGIPIGIISEKKIIEGTNYLDLEMELFTDFRRLSNVYIVNYLHKRELDKLSEP